MSTAQPLLTHHHHHADASSSRQHHTGSMERYSAHSPNSTTATSHIVVNPRKSVEGKPASKQKGLSVEELS